jgi:hypothetical protein
VYKCIGCQDGYLIEYLVTRRGWSYDRLGINGLKSIVFHGPSPTLCIAAGHVWFDHPHVNQVSCATRRKVKSVREGEAAMSFDWHDFDVNPNVCLRYSHQGFQEYREGNGTLLVD